MNITRTSANIKHCQLSQVLLPILTLFFSFICFTHSMIHIIFLAIELFNVINCVVHSGMTNPNYAELNQLYAKYKDQGMRI